MNERQKKVDADDESSDKSNTTFKKLKSDDSNMIADTAKWEKDKENRKNNDKNLNGCAKWKMVSKFKFLKII